jgi:flagellar motor switch protein FliM
LHKAWSEIINIQPRLIKIETDPKSIKNISNEERVVLVILEPNILGVERMINICFPYNTIESILEKLLL